MTNNISYEPTVFIQVPKFHIDKLQETVYKGLPNDAYEYIQSSVRAQLSSLNLSKNPILRAGSDFRIVTANGLILTDYESVIVAKWEISGVLHLRLADGNVVAVNLSVVDI